MFEKLKKALKVAKDLETLEFTLEGMPYTLSHPNNLYTIWTGNGFWFIALYEIGNKYVDSNHKVSKFGAIGKCIVWWKCQKHIHKWWKKYNGIVEGENELLINKVMEDD